MYAHSQTIWKSNNSNVCVRSLVAYRLACYKNNTMRGVTSGAGNAYTSGAHEVIPCISGVCIAQSLVFCVMFCRSFFPLVLFVGLWMTCPTSIYDADYPFGIFKLSCSTGWASKIVIRWWWWLHCTVKTQWIWCILCCFIRSALLAITPPWHININHTQSIHDLTR